MPSSAPVLHWTRPVRGLLKQLHPLEVPPDGLRDSVNWLNRFGAFKTRPGLTKVGQVVSQRPMGFIQYNHENEDDRIVMGTQSQWFRYNSTTGVWVALTGTALGGGNTAQQIFRTFPMSGTTYLLGCNGATIPRVWDGNAGSISDIGGSPPTAKCMAVAAKRLLLATGYNIKSSALGNFNTGWGSELDVNLYDTPGDIVAMLERGNLMTVVYKETSIWNGFAQEELVAPFRFELAVAGIPGPVSPLGVTALEDGSHVFLARNGSLIRFDGVNAESLGESIQTAIAESIDLEQMERAWLAYDAYYNELWVVYTVTAEDDINYGMVVTLPSLTIEPIRYHNNIMSAGFKSRLVSSVPIGSLIGTIGEQNVDIGDYGQAIGAFLLGDDSGQVYHSSGPDDDGNAITHYFATGLENAGVPEHYKTVHGIELEMPKTDSEQLIDVQIAYSEFGETPRLTDPKTVNLGSGGRKRIQHRITSRNFGIRISGEATEELEFSRAGMPMSKRGLR